MKLSIYSFQNIIFQGDAALLNCQTMDGEITILDKHEALISIMTAGVIRIADKDKKEQFFQIKSGFLEVKPGNEVRCIVEQ